MTVNEIIIKALNTLGIPITADFFGEGNEEYITFNYADDRAEVFGDDQPLNAVAYMQIHYFLPAAKDYISTKKRIRKLLHEAGFTYPEVTELTDGKTNRHIIFECEIENIDELIEEE